MKEAVPRPLFTYGSLMENLFNYDLYLAGKVTGSPKKARIKGELYHLDSKGYPALLPGDDWVYGEIFELKEFSKEILPLDKMENYYGKGANNNEYERQLVEVEVFNEATEKYDLKETVYCYLYVPDHDKTFATQSTYLPNGNWRVYYHQIAG